MGRYIARRLAQGGAVIFGVTIFVFIITRVIGDPVKFMLPLSATEEDREERREALGLNDPLYEQFWRFLKDVVSGDFGESTYVRGPASARRRVRLPAAHAPTGRGRDADRRRVEHPARRDRGPQARRHHGQGADDAQPVGLSMPQFFLGYILLITFTVRLQWFETGPGGWKNIILPAICLALPAIGRLSMVVRSSMIDELNAQYVKVAKAKGLSRRRILGVHALRNAGIPYVTLLGWEVIRAVAGYTVVVESVFNWPGLGFMATTAIKDQDFFLIQAIVFVVALMVVIINIAIDISYKALDPRVKLS